MCMIEAMAMELPVLATSVGGPKEVVTDGRDGLLLPPQEPATWAAAASQLLRDREYRTAMGRAARARVVEQMNVPDYVERVLAGYDESLGHSRRRSDWRLPVLV
jgi:glycosyltransferase involved in cell wall biosynthesis